MPVCFENFGGFEVVHADDADEYEDDGQLDDYDGGIEIGGFLDADDQHRCDGENGQEGNASK